MRKNVLPAFSSVKIIYTTLFTITGREKQKHKKQTNNKRMTRNQLN